MNGGLHETVLSDEQVMYLVGNLAWRDGIGADLYQKFRALALRDGLLHEPPVTTDRIAELVADRSNKVTWR